MSLISIGYGDAFLVRIEEYIFGVLIHAFPLHLCPSICWSTTALISICYGDIVRVRFDEYIFSIFFVAYPLHLHRFHIGI